MRQGIIKDFKRAVFENPSYSKIVRFVRKGFPKGGRAPRRFRNISEVEVGRNEHELNFPCE